MDTFIGQSEFDGQVFASHSKRGGIILSEWERPNDDSESTHMSIAPAHIRRFAAWLIAVADECGVPKEGKK